MSAVKSGRVVEPVRCVVCGEASSLQKREGDDYSKPLAMHWLCGGCSSAMRKAKSELLLGWGPDIFRNFFICKRAVCPKISSRQKGRPCRRL